MSKALIISSHIMNMRNDLSFPSLDYVLLEKTDEKQGKTLMEEPVFPSKKRRNGLYGS
jgi:hypothetical protein